MYARLADLLSGSRLVCGLLLIYFGTRGSGTLPTATLVVAIMWTTDQLDGWAARRASTPTRLGRFDFALDVSVYICLLLYLALTGFVPADIVAGFFLICAALAIALRRKAIVVLALRIVDAACAWILIRYDWRLFLAVILWLSILAFVYRRRLLERVPKWLHELRAIIGNVARR